jgi:hypothetical protein
MRLTRLLATLALALGLLAITASTAAASGRDSNNDRIPDRWEKKHGLSLHVKQTNRDQDRDGLKNLGEFRAKTDPRDDDTDNDGTEDGDENAGTVASYDSGTGELVITLSGGGTVTGKVDASTEIKCNTEDEDENENDNDDADEGDDSGSKHRGDDDAKDSRVRASDNGDNELDDDDEVGDEDNKCSAADLKQGTVVHEADLKGGVFEEIELVK